MRDGLRGPPIFMKASLHVQPIWIKVYTLPIVCTVPKRGKNRNRGYPIMQHASQKPKYILTPTELLDQEPNARMTTHAPESK